MNIGRYQLVLDLADWRFGRFEWMGSMGRIYNWSFYIGPLEIREFVQ